MSKESRSAGLGVRFHSLPKEDKHESDEVRRARLFEPEGVDLARLLTRLHGRVRRLR